MADTDSVQPLRPSRSSSSHSSVGDDSIGPPDGPPDRTETPPRTTSPGHSPRNPIAGYQCQLCTFIASTQSAFDEHMNIHTGSRPYRCLECGFSCSLHSTLQQHLAVHRVDMSSMILARQMPDIGKERDSLPPPLMPEVSRSLPLQIATSAPHHTMESLNSMSALSPFSEQNRVFPCKLCTHISPTKTHLNEHMNIHSGKKPYKCLVCGFSSAFRSSLMRHLIVHTGTSKQFKCDQCHYQTPYKCNLQAHRRKRHNLSDGGNGGIGGDHSPTFHNNTSSPSEDGLYKAPRYPSDAKLISDTSGIHNGPPALTHALSNRSASPFDVSDDGMREMDVGNGKMPQHANVSLPQSEMSSAEMMSPQKASPESNTGHPQDASAPGAIDYSGNGSPRPSPPLDVRHSGDSNHSVPSRVGSTTPVAHGLTNNTMNIMSNATSISPTQQPLPPNDNSPHWANFPIFRRKKEGGAKKRKRTPFPKRELVLSPEGEHGTELWIDTRSEEGNVGATFGSGPHHPLSVKTEDLSGGASVPNQAAVNGIDLSGSPRDLHMYKYPQGVVQNARSPGDATTEDSDDNPENPRAYYEDGMGSKNDRGAGSSSSSSGGDAEEDGKMDSQAQTEWMGGDPVNIPHQAVKCPHCETFFTDHVIFTLHMSCHGARIPFQCSICGYVCRDKIEFTCHVTRSQHIR